MTRGLRISPALRALNALILGACFAALFWHPRPFSVAYLLAIGTAAIVLGLGVWSLVAVDPLSRLIDQPVMARPRIRRLAAVSPWLAVLVYIVATGSWWSQQFWAIRLFATYALALWSINWYLAPAAAAEADRPDDASIERLVPPLLVGLAIALGALGANGLAFGAMAFGVKVSAVLACVSVFVAGVALFGRPARRNSLLRNSFGLLLGLLMVEAGIRVLHLGESLQEVDNPEYVRMFHHITPPRSAFLSQPKPLDEFPAVLVETNTMGIRGPEIQPGPVDLMLIGDSMIEARQLPWENTVSARLPAAIAARSATARVVGMGVRGWAPLLEWNWYLKVGRQLRPRVVLLFFFWNDLWVRGNEARTFEAVLRPDGRPDYFNVIVERDWVWYKHVRTIRLAESMLQRIGPTAIKRTLSMIGQDQSDLDLASAEALARRMAGDALLSPAEIDALLTQPIEQLTPRLQSVAGSEFWPSTRPFSLWTDTQRQAAAATERELRLFAEDVAANGGRLVIVHVPNAYQIAPTECSVARYLVGLDGDRLLPPESGIQTWLKDVTGRLGVELLDPSEAMREYHRSQQKPADPLFLRADCHWAVRGHQLMADFLADWYVRTRGR